MTTNMPTDQISPEVAEFLAGVTAKPATARGSLVFALDANGSREPTWDLAVDLQAKMFSDATIGSLDVYFRGTRVDAECKASG